MGQAARIELAAPPPVVTTWSFWAGNFGCGSSIQCTNCTVAQALVKCGAMPIYLDTYGTNVTCNRTEPSPGPPQSFHGEFSCCSELLGPTTFNVSNCFFCPGDADCVESAEDATDETTAVAAMAPSGVFLAIPAVGSTSLESVPAIA